MISSHQSPLLVPSLAVRSHAHARTFPRCTLNSPFHRDSNHMNETLGRRYEVVRLQCIEGGRSFVHMSATRIRTTEFRYKRKLACGAAHHQFADGRIQVPTPCLPTLCPDHYRQQGEGSNIGIIRVGDARPHDRLLSTRLPWICGDLDKPGNWTGGVRGICARHVRIPVQPIANGHRISH